MDIPAQRSLEVCGFWIEAILLGTGAKSSWAKAQSCFSRGIEKAWRMLRPLSHYNKAEDNYICLSLQYDTLDGGLTDAFSSKPMEPTAENVAQRYDISREAQDQFAYQSQMKALKRKQRINLRKRSFRWLAKTKRSPQMKGSQSDLHNGKTEASLKPVLKLTVP